MEQDAIVAHAVSKLAMFAEAGRKGRLGRTRELVVPGTQLIAIYRIRSDLGEVHILRILHARQKYPAE
jgi:plasmid stabilization system protein ParE